MLIIMALIGLCMFVAQVWAAVIILGGHKNAPQWLRIIIGILLIMNFFAIIGLSNNF